MIVQLEVPDEIDFQYVYRTVRHDQPLTRWEEDFDFHFLRSAASMRQIAKPLQSLFGTLGLAKLALKLCTPSRSLYVVTQSGRVVSHGWCTLGRCRYYKIESNAVVIGPIWSDPEVRGKGLATKALCAAMSEHIRLGRSVFYIDTSKSNVPAQRVFEKCGFGDPVALYFRGFPIAQASQLVSAAS